LARETSFKFEGTDPVTGKKFKIHLEGWIPDALLTNVRDAINKIVTGEPIERPSEEQHPEFIDPDSLTIKRKIEILILRNLKRGWFTSTDVQEQYQDLFDENIKPSTASMVLQRLHKRDTILERKGNRNQHQYRLVIDKVKDKIDKITNLTFLK
jgi:hypothetical protein